MLRMRQVPPAPAPLRPIFVLTAGTHSELRPMRGEIAIGAIHAGPLYILPACGPAAQSRGNTEFVQHFLEPMLGVFGEACSMEISV